MECIQNSKPIRKSRCDSHYKCRYCGNIHGKQSCSAFGRASRNCGKQNHFTRVCRKNIRAGPNWEKWSRQNQLHSVEASLKEDYSDDDEGFVAFLGNKRRIHVKPKLSVDTDTSGLHSIVGNGTNPETDLDGNYSWSVKL